MSGAAELDAQGPIQFHEATWRSRRRPSERGRGWFSAHPPSAVLGSASVYAVGMGKETTDDAQVEWRVISVSSRVTGQMAKVGVVDNQLVEAGSVLIELDPAARSPKSGRRASCFLGAQIGRLNAQLLSSRRRGPRCGRRCSRCRRCACVPRRVFPRFQ
jgi:multidrug efflux pump subunit AcrA (membrane-fusion protein)